MTTDRCRETSGQTLPFFALVLPALVGLMALGLDSAQIFLERRDAQSAADLAALAGVRSLPDTPTTAMTDAEAIGVAHGYASSEVTPVTPFGGDVARIEVTINSEVDTYFMGIFGQPKIAVSARAVAKSDWTEGSAAVEGYAIFAMETGCGQEKSVDVSGSNDFFIGRVHSNSDIVTSGSTNDFDGATTYVCGIDDTGGNNTFDPAPQGGVVEPDPIDLDWDYFCPAPPGSGYNNMGSEWDLSVDGPWWVGGTKDSKLLNPGTYCTDDKIKLGDSDITIADVNGSNGITFVGQKVEISGSNFALLPNQDDILFAAYAATDDAMKVAGSGGDWAGLIYAPNGWAELSGQSNGNDSFDLAGGIIAQRVKLNGSDAYIDGSIYSEPEVVPAQTISLVE